MEACENCSLCWLMLFRLYSSVFSVIGVKIYWLVTLLLTFFFAGEAKPTFWVSSPKVGFFRWCVEKPLASTLHFLSKFFKLECTFLEELLRFRPSFSCLKDSGEMICFWVSFNFYISILMASWLMKWGKVRVAAWVASRNERLNLQCFWQMLTMEAIMASSSFLWEWMGVWIWLSSNLLFIHMKIS